MERDGAGRILVAGAVVVLGCSGLATPEAPDLQILVLRQEQGRCTWSLADVHGDAEPVHEDDGPCPASDGSVSWSKGQIARVSGSDLVIAPWQAEGPSRRVPLPAGERYQLRWQPGTAGSDLRITVAALHSAAEEADGATRWLVAGDRRVDATGVPPFGFPAIVVFSQLDGDTWTELAAMPSRFGDGGRGFDVGPFTADSAGMELENLQRRCDSGAYQPPPGADELARELGLEGVGFLEVAEGRGWLFGVVMGDTPHGAGPVFWAEELGHGTRQRLDGIADGEVVSLDARDGWLLVSAEWTGANPRIYPPGKTRPSAAWPDAVGSAWWPGVIP